MDGSNANETGTESEVEQPAEQPARTRGSGLVLSLLIIGGLAGGGGLGAFVLGPRVFTHGAAATAETAGAAEGGESGQKDGKGEGGSTQLYAVENLVVNPAGSGGTRFLLVSVALDVSDDQAVQSLTARDAELRDRVLAVLATKTVEELADLTKRDALKQELQRTAQGVLSQGKVRAVYLPQFVIQ